MNEDGLNMYIEHLDEIHYVPTVEIRTLEFTNNNKCAQIQMTTIQLITVWDIKLPKETAWGDTWKREELRRSLEKGRMVTCCKAAALIANQLGTRKTRLPEKENWIQNMSEKLSNAPLENKKQRTQSTWGKFKKLIHHKKMKSKQPRAHKGN